VTRRSLAFAAATLASIVMLAASTAAQATLIPPVRGVQYGPSPLDIATIYIPASQTQSVNAAASARAGLAAASAGAPAVVLVHGGGWRQQPNETEQPTVANDLRYQGFTVFDINYPQANSHETAFPKQPEAVEAAVDWVQEHGGEYGANPANVVLVGGSAGGNLVDLAGEQLAGVRGVVSLSGPTNLETLVQLGQEAGLKSSLAISLSIALGCGREILGWEKIFACTNTAFERQFSPVYNVPRGACPNWQLFAAEEDLVPASQQEEFLTALQAAGCNASLEVLSGKGHAFGYWWRVKSTIYSFIEAN